MSTLEGKVRRADKTGWFQATKNVSKVWMRYELPVLSKALMCANYAVSWIDRIMFWLIDGTKSRGV